MYLATIYNASFWSCPINFLVAFQLAFGMFGVLVERCNVLLDAFIPKLDIANGDGPQSSIFNEEDLPTLLSAVKVWCDWILGNNDIW